MEGGARFLEATASDAVYSAATLRLGEMHYLILRAANLMDRRRYIKEKHERFTTLRFSEFGEEIGMDEINWWVFKKETSPHELLERTKHALDAAQVLKKASAELQMVRPESYQALLGTLRDFAETHSSEIQALYQYVSWLETRDPMAPKILFTYRVWGSTRMGNRWIEVADDAPSNPDPEIMKTATQIVLGLRDSTLQTYDRAYFEVADEMHTDEYEQPFEIPQSRVVRSAARHVFEECAVYFTQIRDSLRNVVLDLGKYEKQRNLINSDSFWRDFILKAAQTKKTEPQLWDFKKTLDLWRATERVAKDQAKLTLAEDIASFANARGGVLVVGVTDAREIVGVGSGKDLENRLKVARDAIANHVHYPREIVSFRQVVLRVNGEEKVCLVVVIAQAYRVVGVRDSQDKYSFPVRRETGISRASSEEIGNAKMHMKADNHDFMSDLEQFVRDG